MGKPNTNTTARHMVLGQRGEDVAIAHLKRQGLTILQRNWRTRSGELDVLATDGLKLIVGEVKTRSSLFFGAPAEAVTPVKIARIKKLTTQWLTEYRMPFDEIRFDVIAVIWPREGRPRVEHIEGAF